jgi:protein involved in polysaccharide export with SLBB domain
MERFFWSRSGTLSMSWARSRSLARTSAYQIDQASTTIRGIAMAGGFADKAAPNWTKIIRTDPDGRQKTLVVDLNEVLKRGRKDKDLPRIAGDVVGRPRELLLARTPSCAPPGIGTAIARP